MTNKDATFLNYVHSFRGLAILIIVFGHAVGGAVMGAKGVFDESYPILMVSEVLYHDSTIYFAVISGLLFTSVLRPKGFKRFYVSKLKFVLLPYLFLTLVFTLFKMKFKSDLLFDNMWHYLHQVARDFIYGKANFVMWYIPVLVFLYLVTPVLNMLQSTNLPSKFLFGIIILAPLFVSRIQMAHEYVLKWETMVYFTGAYTFGMWLGANLEKNLGVLKRNKFSVVALAILSTVMLFFLYVKQFDFIGQVSLKESCFYVQKLCFAVVILLGFKRFETKQSRWLNIVARDAFAIYFLHGFIIFSSISIFKSILQVQSLEPLNIIASVVLLVLYSTGLSIFTVFVFKKLFRKHSRMLVGA